MIDLKTVHPLLAGCDLLQGKFTDRLGSRCLIQELSQGGDREPCIWLGNESAPMRLTQAMAEALIPHLRRFAERGELRDGGDNDA